MASPTFRPWMRHVTLAAAVLALSAPAAAERAATDTAPAAEQAAPDMAPAAEQAAPDTAPAAEQTAPDAAPAAEPAQAAPDTAPAAGQTAPDAASPAQAAPDTAPAAVPAPDAASSAPDTAAQEAALADEPVSEAEELDAALAFGRPVPLSRREPTLKAGQWGLGLRFAMVGTGPTRFVDDVRYGVTDWFELRSALMPYPSSLMGRVRIGDQQSAAGALIIEGGLAHLDLGVRLLPAPGDDSGVIRAYPEISVGYARAVGERGAVFAAARYNERLSSLKDDGQRAIAADVAYTHDVLDNFIVTGGLSGAATLGTPVRQLYVGFVETGRPGMSYLLEQGVEQAYGLTAAMTYHRTESFDVDIFSSTRVYPKFGIILGLGLRWRFGGET